MQSVLTSPSYYLTSLKSIFVFSQEISHAHIFFWLWYILYKHFMQEQRSGGIHVAAKVLLYVSTALKSCTL